MNPYAVAALALSALAFWVALTGGTRGSIFDIPFSLRRTLPVSLVAWSVFALGVMRSSSPHRGGLTLGAPGAAFRNIRHLIVASVCLAIGVVTVAWGAFVAAGADPYGYVSQALLWMAGNPAQPLPSIAAGAPWPNADWAFCPLGYKPSVVKGLVVPTYSIGLPLQMAALGRALGTVGVYAVVPVSAVLTVWLTDRLATQVCRYNATRLAAVVLTACSPVFLFQSMQPMSDVPVAAWWLWSIVAALDPRAWAALGAGLIGSVAVLIRPNLLPVAAAVGAYVLFGRAFD